MSPNSLIRHVIYMRMKGHSGKIFTGENRRARRKPCPSATLSTTNPTWTDPGANPWLRGTRPATNRWPTVRPVRLVVIWSVLTHSGRYTHLRVLNSLLKYYTCKQLKYSGNKQKCFELKSVRLYWCFPVCGRLWEIVTVLFERVERSFGVHISIRSQDFVYRKICQATVGRLWRQGRRVVIVTRRHRRGHCETWVIAVWTKFCRQETFTGAYTVSWSFLCVMHTSLVFICICFRHKSVS
jgi:hypothetical protein